MHDNMPMAKVGSNFQLPTFFVCLHAWLLVAITAGLLEGEAFTSGVDIAHFFAFFKSHATVVADVVIWHRFQSAGKQIWDGRRATFWLEYKG